MSFYSMLVTVAAGVLFITCLIQTGFFVYLFGRLHLVRNEKNELAEKFDQQSKVLAQQREQHRRSLAKNQELRLQIRTMERDLADAESRLPKSRRSITKPVLVEEPLDEEPEIRESRVL